MAASLHWWEWPNVWKCNIHCNGKARCFREGHERLRKYARCLHRLGYKVHVTRLKRLTSLACHKLSSLLRLEQIAKV